MMTVTRFVLWDGREFYMINPTQEMVDQFVANALNEPSAPAVPMREYIMKSVDTREMTEEQVFALPIAEGADRLFAGIQNA